MRCTYRKKILYFLILFISVIILCPRKSKKEYEVIPKNLIREHLHEELSIGFSSNNTVKCDYIKVIYRESSSDSLSSDENMFLGQRKKGGEYNPLCSPIFSTAIIVPFRKKIEEFQNFLMYMNTFLLRQDIHFRLYVIEQLDNLPFNRAKLLNIGAQIAMEDGFPCLIFHDVDIVPLNIANIYACTKNPRLMSTKLITSWFYFSHQSIPNGVIAIRSVQFQAINGMSNKYFGWGGEEEDLYARIEARNLKLCVFEPDTGEYKMSLENALPSQRRIRKQELSNIRISMETDGLNSLKYVKNETVLHHLFTHVMVNLNVKE